MFLDLEPLPQCFLGHPFAGDVPQAGVLVTCPDAFLSVHVGEGTGREHYGDSVLGCDVEVRGGWLVVVALGPTPRDKRRAL